MTLGRQGPACRQFVCQYSRELPQAAGGDAGCYGGTASRYSQLARTARISTTVTRRRLNAEVIHTTRRRGGCKAEIEFCGYLGWWAIGQGTFSRVPQRAQYRAGGRFRVWQRGHRRWGLRARPRARNTAMTKNTHRIWPLENSRVSQSRLLMGVGSSLSGRPVCRPRRRRPTAAGQQEQRACSGGQQNSAPLLSARPCG